MSAAESAFLQAEAIARGWLTGDDEQAYISGISASCTRFGVADVSALYPYDEYGTDFEAKQQAIITQKWIAMANNQGLESFFEYNRTHYPVLQPSMAGVLQGEFNMPKRVMYPQSEYDANPNTPDAIDVYVKVWWDKK